MWHEEARDGCGMKRPGMGVAWKGGNDVGLHFYLNISFLCFCLSVYR